MEEEKPREADEWEVVPFNENVLSEEECTRIRELGGVTSENRQISLSECISAVFLLSPTPRFAMQKHRIRMFAFPFFLEEEQDTATEKTVCFCMTA